jgi:hypothetical protein
VPRLLLLALAMSSPTFAASPEEASRPLEVLFIGNSYTYRNDLPEMVGVLARAAGVRPLRYNMVAFGGATLAAHWGEGQGDAVRAIGSRRWEAVVLQEQSQVPLVAPELFQHSVRALDERIRAGGARTLLYVTWARLDVEQDPQALAAAYAAVARERQATLVPVGLAWAAVRRALPHLGLYEQDGSHPTPLGSYVAALTFFAVLYGRSPEGLPARLGQAGQVRVELEPATAATVQRLVWETVRAAGASARSGEDGGTAPAP